MAGRANPRPRASETVDETLRPRGAETAAAVQSGDLQGLSDEAGAESESVRELAQEGQDFEAALVDAIENAPPADQGEVRVKEVSEDDVPTEYDPEDPDIPKEE